MANATQRLLDVLKTTQGNCTDYRVSKLFGITTSAVSNWRIGKCHMSDAAVREACRMAGLNDQVLQWRARIGAEREPGAEGQVYRDLLADIEAAEEGRPSDPNGIFAFFARHVAAVILAVGIVFAFPAFSGAGTDSLAARNIHYAYYILRRD